MSSNIPFSVGLAAALAAGCSPAKELPPGYEVSGVAPAPSGYFPAERGGGFPAQETDPTLGSGGGIVTGWGGNGPGGTDCDDEEYEPNNKESQAVDLGKISDDDDDGGRIKGILSTGTDVDWFKYYGEDGYLSEVDPGRDVVLGDIELCGFFQCADGELDGFACPSGTTALESPDGRSGCCSDSGFEVSPECTGIDDSVLVYIRVRHAQAVGSKTCVPYEVDYHL